MVDIILDGLTKIFGDGTVAVDNVCIHIKDQSFVVLVGPSGCGKTTTLRMIAGLEKPTSGKIYFGDTLVNELSPKDRNVAMVFQSYALYPNMTVYNNLSFGLRLKKVSKEEIKENVLRVAKMLGIESLLERRSHQLSGGQKQRVALGRAIIRRPVAFLLDEPLSNLDAKLRVHMRAELKKLHQDLKITTVYVTHDQLEAMTISDLVAVMNLGRIQQIGEPLEVYNSSANKFVAGFLGTPPINFLDCTLVQKDDDISLDCGPFTVRLPKDMADLIRQKISSVELTLGIRPQDVSVSKRKTEDSILSKVYLVEPTGSEQIVYLTIEDKTIVTCVAADMSFGVNEKVEMLFNKRKIHLFDKDGKALL